MPGSMIPPAIVRVVGTIATLVQKIAEAQGLLQSFSSGDYTAKIGITGKELLAAIAKARAELDAALAGKPITVPIGLEGLSTLAAQVLAADAMAQTVADANPVTIPIQPDVNWTALLGETLASGGLTSLLAGAGGAAGGGGGLASLLWGGLSGGGGALAGFGSLGEQAGFGLEGLVIGPLIGIVGSLIGAVIGGSLLGVSGLAVAGVGGATDLAGIGQAAGDIKNVYTALTKLNTAIKTYGANSLEAKTAQLALNSALGGFSPKARTAVLAASQTAVQFHQIFDTVTGSAEAMGAAIITSLLKVAETYLPLIGKFATENMHTIMNALKPFEQWLRTMNSGGGMKIFTNIEHAFQKGLPTAINILTKGFELFAKTVTLLLPDLGHLVHFISEFVTKMNGATFGKWRSFVLQMVTDFEAWWQWLVAVVHVLEPLIGAVAHVGAAITRFWTTVLEGLASWLDNHKTLLHNFFGAHFKELMTGIGSIIKAFIPILETFLTIWLKVATAARQAVTPALEAVGTAIGKLNLGTLIQSVGKFYLALWTALAPALKLVGTLIKAVATVLGQVLPPLIKAISPLVDALAQDIGKILVAALQGVIPLIKDLTPIFVSLVQIITKLIPIITPLAQLLGIVLAGAITAVLKVVDLLVGGLSRVITQLANWVSDILPTKQQWSNYWDDIKKTATSVWHDITQDVLQPIISFFQGPWDTVIGTAKNVWDQVWTTIKSDTLQVWHTLDDTVLHPIAKVIKTTVEKAIQSLQQEWDQDWSAIKGAVQTAWDIITQNLSLIKTELHTVGKILSSLGITWSSVWTTMKTMLQGNVGIGIKVGLEAIKLAITAIASALAGAAEAAHLLVSALQALSSGGSSILHDLNPFGGNFLGIPGMAKGGLVEKPTLAVVGEAGPEFIIPLSQLMGGASALGGTISPLGAVGAIGGGALRLTLNYHYTVHGAITQASAAQLQQLNQQNNRDLVNRLRAGILIQ